MLHYKPLSLYEAYFFLQSMANGFSVEEYFERLKHRHPACRSIYNDYEGSLKMLYERLGSVLNDDAAEVIDKLFTSLSNGSKANRLNAPCLCSLFADAMSAFRFTDYDEFRAYLYGFSENVPALIIENVSGELVSGECDASMVFDAVTASALPQKNKNNIIAAALNPGKFIDSLIDLLIPVAEEYERCEEIWSPFIEIFRDDYQKFDSEADMMRSKFNYSCDEESEFNIFPSVTAFYHCDVFTGIPNSGENKLTTALIGVLYDTFQRQSESTDNDENEVARLMSILGEPSRFKIILRLMNGPAYVGELAKCVNLAPCTVSQHLSVLTGAKLVTSVDSGRRVYHSINHEKVDKFVDAIYSMLRSK